ncbi:MAG: putative DNA binding domain-containing protein [Acidobacteria bacterium]|jgi:ATP-dependent DNA helicase RecG|nr:putative DNA binding domain-containing protein [Acidobacteriota bacterium]
MNQELLYTKDEVYRLINGGENSSVEFKSDEVKADSLAKEIVAFSNTNGGVILLGIEDDGKITGLSGSKVYEEWIANIARNNVIPAVQLSYDEMIITEKRIGIIRIPKGKDKPYQTLHHQFLIRVGSTNRVATQSELMRLFQQSGVFHFDANGVEGTSFIDLNLAKIDSYFNRYEIDFSHESEAEKISLLKNTDILDKEGKVTIAGLLIFGINPQRYLYNAGISFAHFNGNEITADLIDKQNIDNTIDFQVDTAFAVIKNNLLQPSTIVGTKRINSRFIYSDKVFRELLINACVHRNYAISGSRIRVFLFSDRIEFLSPGNLPNTVTIEKMRAGVSYAVNPIIVKFMENLRYIDKLGRGIPMVCKEVEKNNKEIIFKELGEEFKVILYL